MCEVNHGMAGDIASSYLLIQFMRDCDFGG